MRPEREGDSQSIAEKRHNNYGKDSVTTYNTMNDSFGVAHMSAVVRGQSALLLPPPERASHGEWCCSPLTVSRGVERGGGAVRHRNIHLYSPGWITVHTQHAFRVTVVVARLIRARQKAES